MSTKTGTFASHLFSVLMLLTLLVSAVGVTPVHAAGILYATSGASGTGDCYSWANACALQTALTSAVSGDEIWAAAGTHKPTTVGTDRSATFQLIDGVAVYGGFAGTETARNQRDPAANVTVLSGDIDNNDSQTPIITDLTTVTGNTTNSYHVSTGATDATLDGFTITAGNANGDYYLNHWGGGIYNESSSPMLMNVIFSGNSALGGGGMYNYDSSPTLTNVTFSNNSAMDGGGMINTYGSNPTLTDVTFSGNSASWGGGGMENGSSSPVLTNVTFSSNSANRGGGMFNSSSSSPTLTNVTFSDNSADIGGGMSNQDSNSMLTNVTFSDNSATSEGGGMYNIGSSPQIRNAIFWGNMAPVGAQIFNGGSAPSVSDSVVQAGCPAGSTCTNIIIADPLLGALGNYGGLTQTIPLLPGSSAIDTGNDAICPVTDQRGVARPQGAHCDIGSYERDTVPPTVVSVNRASADPTSIISVIFTVTFSESVTGVDMDGPVFDDFALTTTGLTGTPVVTGVGGSGTTYNVMVSTGSGNGTIRLDVKTGGSIVDATLNPLSVGFTTGEVYTVIKTATFTDVPLDYWAWGFIERLYNAGVTGGCSTTPLMYCPDTVVTRAQMAVFLLKGSHGSSYAPPAVGADTGFSDVPITHWAAAWIKQLAAEGITSGCGATTYCPESGVTRDQMAIFLLRGKHSSAYVPPAVGASTGFDDVPITYWDAAWIKQLALEGITGGCGASTYCPGNPVTRAEMAVFLVRTFSLP